MYAHHLLEDPEESRRVEQLNLAKQAGVEDGSQLRHRPMYARHHICLIKIYRPGSLEEDLDLFGGGVGFFVQALFERPAAGFTNECSVGIKAGIWGELLEVGLVLEVSQDFLKEGVGGNPFGDGELVLGDWFLG